MGFFSNLTIDQETDREHPVANHVEEVSLKAEPAYTTPPVETAGAAKAVSVETGTPKADKTENAQPAQQTEEEKRKAHEDAEAKR